MTNTCTGSRRRLQPLVITMGSERQSYIKELFSNPIMSQHFEPPVFSEGVPSRSLRNRTAFFRIVNEAGLIPEEEWKALDGAIRNEEYAVHPERLFDCLKEIPVQPGRRGNKADIEMHYSVELWRKAKSVNRGRAILACALAHLLAMKRCVSEQYDFILEDNVRAPPDECAMRIWEALDASKEWEHQTKQKCHLRYYGWLGSKPNLKWVLSKHSERTKLDRTSAESENPQCTIFPFPQTQDISSDDLKTSSDDADELAESNEGCNGNGIKRKPGGTPIWGAYSYWISAEGLECLLSALKKDVGALLWKGKRMRCHVVKPIDKVLPRQIIKSFSASAIHCATHPAFFRAPMLTSKLHAQFDPEFCKSTELQLKQTCLAWSDLWLTGDERKIVEHSAQHDVWISMEKLSKLESSKD